MKDQLQTEMSKLTSQRGNLARAIENVDREIDKIGFGLQLIEAQEKQAEAAAKKAAEESTPTPE